MQSNPQSNPLFTRHPAALFLALLWLSCAPAAAQSPAAQSTVPDPAAGTPQAAPSPPSPPADAMVPPPPPPAATTDPVPQPQSQPQSDPAVAEFDALDRDGDSQVSANEHAQGAKAKFDALDADHNYHVSTQEMDRVSTGGSVSEQILGADRIRPMDANGNGQISPDESRANAEAEFRARDGNRDGTLSLEELRGGAPAQPQGD